MPEDEEAGLKPGRRHWRSQVPDDRLMLADTDTYFDKRLLNFHSIETVQRVDDLNTCIRLVVEARYAPQAVHAPGLVSA